jgi:hypothetical protein
MQCGGNMSGYCEDCGCKTYNGRCVNCHEELYILDQYFEQGMPTPDPESDFMKRVAKETADVNRKTSTAFINGKLQPSSSRQFEK